MAWAPYEPTWGSLHRYIFLNSVKVRSENWLRPTCIKKGGRRNALLTTEGR